MGGFSVFLTIHLKYEVRKREEKQMSPLAIRWERQSDWKAN